MDELDNFISSILDAKQLSGVTDEVRANLIEDMRGRLLDQINRALIDGMPDDKIDQFNDLLEQDGISDEQLQQFVKDSGVDIPTVTAATMLRFRELYLGNESAPSDNQNETKSE